MGWVMKFIKINENTAKEFYNNLKNKKHMICYVYYEWKGMGNLKEISFVGP